MEDPIDYQVFRSPAGKLLVGSWQEKLVLCDWMDRKNRQALDDRILKATGGKFREHNSGIITGAISQLQEYFSGNRTEFTVPLLQTGTEFQQEVWNELLKIPYGRKVTYSGLAGLMGDVKRVRAVAGAVGANPLSLFIPCHRVTGIHGDLTGYAGGIEAKRFLLNLEDKTNLFAVL
jgi:methylated-DNA-[protein]-cysteine S-methyltransferase